MGGVINGVGTAKGDGWTYSVRGQKAAGVILVTAPRLTLHAATTQGQWQGGEWHGDGTVTKWDAEPSVSATAVPASESAAADAAAVAAAAVAAATAAATSTLPAAAPTGPRTHSTGEPGATLHRPGWSHQGSWRKGVAHGHGTVTHITGAATATGEAETEVWEVS